MRDILRNAVKEEGAHKEGLGSRIATRFKDIGLEEGEEIPEMRGYPARPVEFDP